MTIEIKICGLTRPADAALAVELGATQVGCVMSADSPRAVTPAQAKEIFLAAGRKVRHVLVFRAAARDVITESARIAGTKHVQLAAFLEIDASTLEKAGLSVCRVHEVPTGANMLPPLLPEPTEKSPAILMAAAAGTGLTFPWEILAAEAPHATLIGGGVRPENVCALLTHHPYGLDITSGIEIEPGIKDPDRMALLFETLRSEA